MVELTHPDNTFMHPKVMQAIRDLHADRFVAPPESRFTHPHIPAGPAEVGGRPLATTEQRRAWIADDDVKPTFKAPANEDLATRDWLRGKGGFVQLLPIVLQHPDLTDSDKILISVILNHTRSKKTCWPRVQDLADECGKSERAIQLQLAKLEEKGVLARDARGGSRGKGGKATRYYMLKSFWRQEKGATSCAVKGATPCTPEGEAPCALDGETPCTLKGETPCTRKEHRRTEEHHGDEEPRPSLRGRPDSDS